MTDAEELLAKLNKLVAELKDRQEKCIAGLRMIADEAWQMGKDSQTVDAVYSRKMKVFATDIHGVATRLREVSIDV